MLYSKFVLGVLGVNVVLYVVDGNLVVIVEFLWVLKVAVVRELDGFVFGMAAIFCLDFGLFLSLSRTFGL